MRVEAVRQSLRVTLCRISTLEQCHRKVIALFSISSDRISAAETHSSFCQDMPLIRILALLSSSIEDAEHETRVAICTVEPERGFHQWLYNVLQLGNSRASELTYPATADSPEHVDAEDQSSS